MNAIGQRSEWLISRPGWVTLPPCSRARVWEEPEEACREAPEVRLLLGFQERLRFTLPHTKFPSPALIAIVTKQFSFGIN